MRPDRQPYRLVQARKNGVRMRYCVAVAILPHYPHGITSCTYVDLARHAVLYKGKLIPKKVN